MFPDIHICFHQFQPERSSMNAGQPASEPLPIPNSRWENVAARQQGTCQYRLILCIHISQACATADLHCKCQRAQQAVDNPINLMMPQQRLKLPQRQWPHCQGTDAVQGLEGPEEVFMERPSTNGDISSSRTVTLPYSTSLHRLDVWLRVDRIPP